MHTTTLSGDFLRLLTESLMGNMREVAQEIEQCGLDHDAYPEPLARLDGIRAALDALCWGTVPSIDVDAHRQVIEASLSSRLTDERCLQADAEAMSGNPDAERQRQRAYAYTLEIERFMSDAGLTIPPAGESDA
jgi:hypothetical protein